MPRTSSIAAIILVAGLAPPAALAGPSERTANAAASRPEATSSASKEAATSGTTATTTTPSTADRPAEPDANASVPPGQAGDGQWWSWSRATGEWNGVRRDLETLGVSVGLSMTADLSHTRSSVRGVHFLGRALVDANTSIDLERLLRIRGLSAFAQHLSRVGDDGSECAGDHQGFSNIDAPRFAKAGELWVQQWIVADRLRVKAGGIDANTEFAAVDAAGAFLNSSMGFSPTIVLLPTYPDPRVGFVVAAQPSSALGLSVGAYDGASEDCEWLTADAAGHFYIGELRTAWTLGRSGLPGTASVGLWRHTGTRRRLDGQGELRGTGSGYVTFEQTLWQSVGDQPARVRVFGQYGTASALASELDRHVGAGVVWDGVVASRPADAVGMAVTSVRLSDRLIDRTEDGSETAFAAFYRYQVTPWLAVHPDVQYVVHEAGLAPRHQALLATVRLQLEF